MTKMNILPLILLLLIVMGCSKQSNQSSVDQSLVNQLMADTDTEGLPFWTADTIKKTNPELVFLMDTLYRYVRSENYLSMDLEDKRSWMNNYRKQLVAYYDRNHLGPDTVSLFDKATVVILEADSLWALNTDDSTMGIIIKGGSEITRRKFQEFNEFEKLVSVSKSPEETQILKDEYSAWISLQGNIADVVFNSSSIIYCGGSLRGIIDTNALLDIIKAHINLYKRDFDIWTYSPDISLAYGVFPEGGKDLLLSCVKILIKDSYSSLQFLLNDESYNNDLLNSDYKALLNANEYLPESINRWINARKKEIDFATNSQASDLNLNSGEMLVRLSSVVSSIK